jgi:hypothetical protein
MPDPEVPPVERGPSIIKHATGFGIGGFILSLYTGYFTGNLPSVGVNEGAVIGVSTIASIATGGIFGYIERRKHRQEQQEKAATSQRVEAISRMEDIESSFLTQDDIDLGLYKLQLFANGLPVDEQSSQGIAPETD